jgi:hypothetical protein
MERVYLETLVVIEFNLMDRFTPIAIIALACQLSTFGFDSMNPYR